tara:strand:+ start:5419 stop:5703 length:285 start_codon:yes stop_codon:yes gene_type:complete
MLTVTNIESSSSVARVTPSGKSTSVAETLSPTFNSEISISSDEGMSVGNAIIVIVLFIVCITPPSSFTPIGTPVKSRETSASTVCVRSICIRST